MTAQLMNLIKNSQITNPGDDSKFFPESQIKAKFKVQNSVLLMPYGINSVPPINSFGVTFAIGGDEGNNVTIPHAPHLRVKGLKAGEVVVSNLLTGSKVKFSQDGSIEVDSKNKIAINAAGEITIDAPVLTINAPVINMIGNVNLTGNLTGSGTFAMGGGGAVGIARLGDSVAGGIITSASTNSTTT